MTDRQPNVYAIPAGIAFVDALARGLLDQAGGDPLALAAMTVLLPTRRAQRSLSEAFLRVTEGKALLLPRMLALADLDRETPGFDSPDLPAALDPLERRLILARLVMLRGGAFAVSPDQALRLAEALADLIDAVETEGVEFAGLKELAGEEFALHWQKTLEFLTIVTEHWPAILADLGVVDPGRRRVMALAARTAEWRAAPPADQVIAAGFISADPALADLIATVATLPRGMVVLPGLDSALDNEGWDAIEPIHPQFGIKRQLDHIGIGREEVRPWPGTAAEQPRARLLTEALRPAETTEQWREGPRIQGEALSGLARADCATIGEEAEVIALAMREALETPGRTAALVTADRALARRTASALRRWGIDVDDSAGRPLAETPVGVWLRLVSETVIADFAPRPLLAMLKHPLAACGLPTEDLRRNVRALERAALRGPRPGPGIDGLIAALVAAPLRKIDGGEDEKRALLAWIADLRARLGPFSAMAATGHGGLSDLLRLHAEAAEALAETPGEAGALRLWRGQDGEAAADLLARLEGPMSAGFPELPADRYPIVLAALMAGVTVRPLYGAHPRLSIWGLIEARLQSADLMILGGLNEGSWPPLPADEPWMSRKMRQDFGLPPLEAEIGVAAQDFVLAAASKNVLLTRSDRVDGAPSVPARFLSRLDTLLAGSGLAIPAARHWADWANTADLPGEIRPWPRPEPRPPLVARPRELPVTAIETWVRDPYALYAGRILKLRPLDPLDADPSAAERGKFIHDALDTFIGGNLVTLPPDALPELLRIGRAAFGDALAHPSVEGFWWPRFERIAAWFVDFERARRADGIYPLATEVKGRLLLESRGGDFVLRAMADRIDRLPDGTLAIMDYKTGGVPSVGDVKAGFSPQLTLEGAIAESGGFDALRQALVADLVFLQLRGGTTPGELAQALGRNGVVQDAIADAYHGLLNLVERFDDPRTAYPPQPESARGGDYDHLARIDEWNGAA